MRVWTWLHNNWEAASLGVILVAAILIRLIGFPQIPVSLYWDEMAMWNDALSVHATGLDMLGRHWFQPLFISYGDYKLPVYIWLVTAATFVTKSSLLAVRLPSFLAGVSMVLGTYLFWKGMPQKIPGKGVLGVFSAAVMAFLPWSMHFSTVGFEGHLAAAWILWSLVALVWSWRVEIPWRKILLVSLSTLAGILSFYTYFSARFVWPILFIVGVILWWKYAKKYWWLYVLGVMLWTLSLVPMFRADFYGASNQLRLSTQNIMTVEETQQVAVNVLREDSGNSRFSRFVYNRPVLIAWKLVQNMSRHLDPEFLFHVGDGKLRHGVVNHGLLFPVMAPFLVVGLLSIWRKQWRIGMWLSAWWALALVPASVPLDTPHALRSLNALVPLAVLVAVGMVSVFRWLWTLGLPALVRWFVVGVCVLAVAFSVAEYSFTRWYVYPTVSADDWQGGYIPLAQYLGEVHDEYETILVDSFDQRFFLYYQPYSDLSWSEIQTIESQWFIRFQIGNVTIVHIDDETELSGHSLAVVEVSRREEMPTDWQEIDQIYGEVGEEQFAVFTPVAE